MGRTDVMVVPGGITKIVYLLLLYTMETGTVGLLFVHYTLTSLFAY